MNNAANTTPQERQAELIELFSPITDWAERYKKVIAIGGELPELPEAYRTDQLKVKGCQSSVWLHAQMNDGRVYFQADSDASIVKGLVALVVHVYSGATPQEIMQTPPDFLEKLGFNQNLSQTRVSGLAAMIKQVRLYAFALKTLADQKK